MNARPPAAGAAGVPGGSTEPEGASAAAPARPPAHGMDPVERTVHGVLLVGIVISVALMAAGLVLGLLHGSGIPRGVVPVAELPEALLNLEPAAYLSLGLIVLIATPFVRVAGSLVAFAREGDRRYVLISAAVLVVMCASVGLGKL